MPLPSSMDAFLLRRLTPKATPALCAGQPKLNQERITYPNVSLTSPGGLAPGGSFFLVFELRYLSMEPTLPETPGLKLFRTAGCLSYIFFDRLRKEAVIIDPN